VSTDRLRFGAFMGPYHTAGENPTLALHRDLDLAAALDRFGFDELWVGEHHSGGSEIIGCPEIFLAAAAERTRSIRLGTGVVPVAYHNPLWVAERIVLLDHLTRGRVMLGLGPGGVVTDSLMVGLGPEDTRPLMEEGVRCITALLRGEAVTSDTPMWRLCDARLHIQPYSSDLEVAVSVVASPSGARLAGDHGLSMLSIGATQPAGFEALAGHWAIAEDHAARAGTTVDRSRWRLLGLLHIAETRAQAERDVAHGIEAWFRYFQQTVAVPQVDLGSAATVGEMIDYVRESGLGAIGTADDALAQIERLRTQSGGFGTYVTFLHEWADPAATLRSYELLAQRVMPELQGHGPAGRAAAARAATRRDELFGTVVAAHDAAVARHHAAP
jgi:limonene 1,2-monooxygenase